MRGNPPSRLAFLVPGVVCLGFAVALGVQMGRTLGEEDLWPAPEEAASLDAVRDRAEILYDGQSLELALRSGALQQRDGSEAKAEQFGVLLNDADRVSGRRLALLAAASTAAVVLLLCGLLLPGGRRPKVPS